MNQDNLLVICENNYKEKFLKNSFEKKKFLNVKFYTKREFFKKYFFDYTNKTIYYLVKKYNLKIEVDTQKRSIADALKLLSPDNIVDINISNIPLEDIISNIYKKTSI